MVSTRHPHVLGELPALAGLSRLRDMRPTVVVDTREQTPLVFARLPSTRGTLQTGDYSFRGGEDLVAIERKTVADLVACCVGENRDRFFRELHRMRGFRFHRLLVVGSRRDIEEGLYRGKLNPRAILSTLAVIETRFDVPVVFAASPEEAAELVETWVWWMAREIACSANDLLRGCESQVGELPEKRIAGAVKE